MKNNAKMAWDYGRDPVCYEDICEKRFRKISEHTVIFYVANSFTWH